MARRILLAAALGALTLGGSTPSAFAHEGNPNYESLVRGVTPSIPGFAVEVLNGDDRLEVRNTGPRAVTIEGYDEEPYLRLLPGGRVEANVRSPAYYLNQERLTGAPVPALADAQAAPQWKVVARTARYEFHDHRMHWMAKSVPDQVGDRAQRTKIFDWNVPLRAGSATGAIRGELFWRGEDGGAPAGAIVALAVLGLVGGAAVVIVRRRRRSADAGRATPRAEAW